MSAVPQPRMTEEEYLAFERASDTKHEFIDGEVVAMAGAKRRHNLIVASVVSTLYSQVSQRPCELYPNDMRVQVNATGLYTYPDIVIVCGEPEFLDDTEDNLLNPTVIIEVLSESTEAYDPGRKFQHYRELDSLREYLLISQDTPRIERHMLSDNGKWELTDAVGLEATLHLPSIDADLRLADVYEKVNFDKE